MSMKKKSNRAEIKDLHLEAQELTRQEMEKVQGGVIVATRPIHSEQEARANTAITAPPPPPTLQPK